MDGKELVSGAAYDVYMDIKKRTNGEIYFGVVGPVRTGKSTFIKRFMELCVDRGKRVQLVHKPHRAPPATLGDVGWPRGVCILKEPAHADGPEGTSQHWPRCPERHGRN